MNAFQLKKPHSPPLFEPREFGNEVLAGKISLDAGGGKGAKELTAKISIGFPEAGDILSKDPFPPL